MLSSVVMVVCIGVDVLFSYNIFFSDTHLHLE
jgi:hypothetical protein